MREVYGNNCPPKSIVYLWIEHGLEYGYVQPASSKSTGYQGIST